MRVFYDHQVTSLQDAGGISRYYFELVQALLRVHATGQDDGADPRDEPVKPELFLGFNRSVLRFASLRPGARISSVATSMRPGPLRYALNEALTSVAVPLRGCFDVYHATYQRVLPAIRKRALVVTHHDSTPDRFPHLFLNASAIHARLKRVYAQADRIICISESSRQDLLHFFAVVPEKTVVIHHGFSTLPLPAHLADKDRGDLSWVGPCEQPYLLYVGSRAAYKNFPVVLQALAQQPHKDLHLVAAGGGALTAEEVGKIAELQLTGRVHGLSRVTDAQLAALYRRAEIFVYPSLYEGFGFPPLEAMSLGCPVLVSRGSALPEICGDAAFYFDPGSADDLTASLTKMLDDDVFRNSKREAGYRQIKRYTWQQAATETLAIYRSAASGC